MPTFKKGSKAAKDYMASIRKLKGKPKAKKTTAKKVGAIKIGALPIGFKGSFLGFKFDVINQYTIDGGVTAIIRDSEFNKLFELNGRKEDELKGSKLLYAGSISYWSSHNGDFLSDRDKLQLNKRIENFVKQLNKEVKDFNSGKDKNTKKVKPVKIVYTPEIKKLSVISEIKTILKNNNKILVRGYKIKTGNIRKISGTSTHKDTKSHNVNIRVVSGIQKTINGMQKTYMAIYQNKGGIIDTAIFKASSLLEAKKYASAHKRHSPELKKYKSVSTSVKLYKN